MPQDYNPQALSEFKRANLDSKIFDKQAGTSAKLASIFGPSEADIARDADIANLRQLAQQEHAATVQREGEAVLSDEAAEGPVGFAANQALNLTSKFADVVIGQTSRLGINLADAFDDATIPTEDKQRYQTIQDKREAGNILNKQLSEMASKPAGTYTPAQIDEVRAQYDSTQLTEEEELFSDPNKQRTSKGEASFKKLEKAKIRDQMREIMTQPFAQLEKWVNKGNKDKAVARVRDEVERAAIEFDDDNYGDAVGTVFGAVSNLVTDDIDAAGELLIDSAAHMIALAKNAPVAIATIGSDMLSSSTKEFEKEHKRPAEPKEMAYMALLVYGSVGLDAIGAKVSLGASTGFHSIVNTAKKLDLKVPKSLVDTATQLGKVVPTAPLNVARAATVEGVTEASQEVLEQQAVTQDISKTDVKQALVSGVIGAAIGGGISVPSATVRTVKDVTDTAAPSLEKVRKGINKGAASIGIGALPKIVAQAKKKNPKVGLKAILSTKVVDIPVDKREGYIDDLYDLSKNLKEEIKASGKVDPKAEEQLKGLYASIDKFIDTVDRLATEGKTADSAVDVLNSDQAGPELKAEAVETIVNDVQTSATLSPKKTKEALGSDSSFRENATAEDIEIIEDYNNYIEATAALLDDAGDSPVLPETDKFKGIRLTVAHAKKAARAGNTKALKNNISKLEGFTRSRKEFLTTEEITALEATAKYIKNIKVKPQVSPKVRVAAKEQVKAEPEAFT